MDQGVWSRARFGLPGLATADLSYWLVKRVDVLLQFLWKWGFRIMDHAILDRHHGCCLLAFPEGELPPENRLYSSNSYVYDFILSPFLYMVNVNFILLCNFFLIE